MEEIGELANPVSATTILHHCKSVGSTDASRCGFRKPLQKIDLATGQPGGIYFVQYCPEVSFTRRRTVENFDTFGFICFAHVREIDILTDVIIQLRAFGCQRARELRMMNGGTNQIQTKEFLEQWGDSEYNPNRLSDILFGGTTS